MRYCALYTPEMCKTLYKSDLSKPDPGITASSATVYAPNLQHGNFQGNRRGIYFLFTGTNADAPNYHIGDLVINATLEIKLRSDLYMISPPKYAIPGMSTGDCLISLLTEFP